MESLFAVTVTVCSDLFAVTVTFEVTVTVGKNLGCGSKY